MTTFDLVTSCFLRSEVEIPRGSILRRAATAVAPGGTLLIVGHSGAPHWPRPDDGGHTHPQLEIPTPDDVYATLFTDSALDPQGWSVLTSALVERIGAAPDGTARTIVDSVLILRRNT
ncbi:hypothetical protein BH09ACT2_BH09ACT2_18040 [soil metagenome]